MTRWVRWGLVVAAHLYVHFAATERAVKAAVLAAIDHHER